MSKIVIEGSFNGLKYWVRVESNGKPSWQGLTDNATDFRALWRAKQFISIARATTSMTVEIKEIKI